MPSITKNVAARVAARRQERGLSQEMLAKKARIHRMTIQRLEQARHPPNVKTLDRIARALGVTLVDLVE